MMSIKQSGLIALIGSLSLLAQFARAEISSDIAEASAPLSEGVPEVAVVRLQALLAKQLSDPEWQAVVEKLAEAAALPITAIRKTHGNTNSRRGRTPPLLL